jgi:hypothetical protein
MGNKREGNPEKCVFLILGKKKSKIIKNINKFPKQLISIKYIVKMASCVL